MSSSASGIPVSSALKNSFETARTLTNVAFFKVQIVDNELVSTHSERKGGLGWGRDYDQITKHLDDTNPAFIIFFKGREELVLILYVPEDANVQQKMKYSASKGALNSLLNARHFIRSGSATGSQAVEQVFATSKADLTHNAYSSHASVKGPMSEVEEALQALPKTLDKKEFAKSQGYSLLAAVSGKALPPQLQNYAAGNAAAHQSVASFRGGGQHNFFAKPSEARQANQSNGGFRANRPPPGQAILPGFGSAAIKANPNNSPTNSSSIVKAAVANANGTASSSPVSSPTAAAVSKPATSPSSAGGVKAASSSPVRSSSPAPKCLVDACPNQRFKQGYCPFHASQSQSRLAQLP